MGIDLFGVTMHFVETGVYEPVKEILKGYSEIQLRDEETTVSYKSITGQYSDGNHFIDFQLANQIARNECTLAIRFSLCSYPSIDDVFIQIVGHILTSFEAEVWLMTSALKEKNNYPPGELSWLVSALPDEIKAMRRHWQSLFGTKQGTVRVEDSFSFVGLKTI